MKCAFLVTGCESSGTKLVTQTLIAGGCFGDAGNEQRLWKGGRLDALREAEDPIVLRLSMPHGLENPDLTRVLWNMHSLGYTPRTLVCVRDWYACGESQIHEQTHAFNAEHSQAKRERAYRDIFAALAHTRTPFCIVTYESIVDRPHVYLRELLRWCGLRDNADLPRVYDGNCKWYAYATRNENGG